MKKIFIPAVVLSMLVLFCASAGAVKNSCLDSCDKYSGSQFKYCMENCRARVTGEKPSPGASEMIPDINAPEIYVPGGAMPIVEKAPEIKMPPKTGAVKTPSSTEKPAVKDPSAAKSIAAGACPAGMVKVAPGDFTMGCGAADTNCGDDEKPAKKISITKAFCIDTHETTQAQYKKETGKTPSEYKDCGDNCPVENVAWADADSYCKKIGKRLPTEAEWEYAARGGTSSVYSWGDSMNDDYAWYDSNSSSSPQPVGQKKPNAFGLYDVSGNVWEWVQDCYSDKWYADMPASDPVNSAQGCDAMSLRGGSWNDVGSWLRSSNRAGITLGEANSVDGIRCALDVK